jgi:hypothetical protein
MTTKTAVVIVGLEPERANLAPFPGLTVEKLKAGINAAGEALRALGFEIGSCMIPPEVEVAEAMVEAYLSKHRADVVVIGAGVRTAPEQLLLFERLINLVHRHAPNARICFNTQPGDTVQAVQRWVQG